MARSEHSARTPPGPGSAPGGHDRAGSRWMAWIALAVVLAAAAGLAGWRYVSTRHVRSASGVALGKFVGVGAGQNLNLLVITLDTTRADRIGAYGSKDV